MASWGVGGCPPTILPGAQRGGLTSFPLGSLRLAAVLELAGQGGKQGVQCLWSHKPGLPSRKATSSTAGAQ